MTKFIFTVALALTLTLATPTILHADYNEAFQKCEKKVNKQVEQDAQAGLHHTTDEIMQLISWCLIEADYDY